MQGYVQVYTGNGKGKTTAAVGLAIRALGAGLRVLFLQFMKSCAYSEQKLLKGFEPALKLETLGKPYFVAVEGMLSAEEAAKWQEQVVVFPPGQPPRDYLELVAAGMRQAKDAAASGEYDLVVLDEVICALHFGLISWPELLALIDGKAAGTELVLTGRGAPPELIARADLVTDMQEIKHYYTTQGLEARPGIEN
ncbi:MAG: cob(I)yrinic acid a,c-diamide adenosyltransferase [Sporomusaceae bacterium]|nr:cob(I)yrinic acid a,c-diamide adenosyltransferase [Sporomusaceae bacterium]